MIAQATSYLWFAGLILVFGGDYLFKFVGMAQPPELYHKVKQNQTMVLAGLFILNSVGNSQLATGAFEIYVDEQLIFSKLAVGRTPTQEDIMQVAQFLASAPALH